MSEALSMIALRPKYWEMYKDGSKTWELRKAGRCPLKTDKLIIYATSPVCRIIGEADLLSVRVGHLDYIWDIVNGYCGVTRDQYNSYYRDQHIAVAYRLGHIWAYSNPVRPDHHVQGYRYLRAGEYDDLRRKAGLRIIVHAGHM